MTEFLALFLFLFTFGVLLAGYPVAFSLGGSALLFAFIGSATGTFDPAFLEAIPNRISGTLSNELLVAIPLFVFMGVMLEKSRIAEDLLDTMGQVFGGLAGVLSPLPSSVCCSRPVPALLGRLLSLWDCCRCRR